MWDFHNTDQVPCKIWNDRMEEEAEQVLSYHQTDGNFFSTVCTYIDGVHTSYMALLHTTLCFYIYGVYLFQPSIFCMSLIVCFLH
jgi:hypothetical protein